MAGKVVAEKAKAGYLISFPAAIKSFSILPPLEIGCLSYQLITCYYLLLTLFWI